MKIKMSILIIALLSIFFTQKDLDNIDKINKNFSYKEKMSNKSRIYSMVGMKKPGVDLIWLEQIQNIGSMSGSGKKNEIKETSLIMSELNPYFLENYYISANVLAFIKIYKDYEGAQDILNRGIKYNPKDRFLKNYLFGLVAETKGEELEVLKNFEEIAQKYPDPLMIKRIYDIYFKLVKKDKKYSNKYIEYAEILYSMRDKKYQIVVETNLRELGFIK